MEIKLYHHIYTSRFYSFETCAQSPELKEIRSLLEGYTIHYPSEINKFGFNPILYRGFKLPQQNNYALMLMKRKGSDLSGREGNYQAHTFIINENDLSSLNWNLPFAAAYLSGIFNYWIQYDLRVSREIIQLEPITLEIENALQFRMLRLFLNTILKEEYYKTIHSLMLSLEKRETSFPLYLGQLPLNIDELTESFDLIKPQQDECNLWRTVALFALLPSAYKKDISFSINEVSFKSTAKQPFDLTVLLNKTIEEAPDVIVDSKRDINITTEYLKTSLEKIEKEDKRSLSYDKHNHFLVRFNEFCCTLNFEVFENSVRYFNDIVANREQGKAYDSNCEALYLKELIRLQPEPTQQVIESAVNCLKTSQVDSTKKFALLTQVTKRLFSDNLQLQYKEKFIEEIVQYFASCNQLSNYEKEKFFYDLPSGIQIQWWNFSEILQVLPAYLQNNLPLAIAIGDIVIRENRNDSAVKFISNFVGRIIERLPSIAKKIEAKNISLTSNYENISLIEGLLTLLSIKQISSLTFQEKLIHEIVNQILKKDEPDIYYNNAFTNILCRTFYSQEFLNEKNNYKYKIITILLKRLLIEYMKKDRQIFFRCLLDVSDKKNNIDGMIIFLKNLTSSYTSPSDSIVYLINAQIELFGSLRLEFEKLWFRSKLNIVEIELPEYKKWLQAGNDIELSKKDIFEAGKSRFYQNMCHELKKLPVDEALAVGVSYLYNSKCKSEEILNTLHDHITNSHNPSKVCELLAIKKSIAIKDVEENYKEQMLSYYFLFAELVRCIYIIKPFNKDAMLDNIQQIIFSLYRKDHGKFNELKAMFKKLNISTEIFEKKRPWLSNINFLK